MTTLLRFLPALALLLIGGGLWLLYSIGAALVGIGLLIWLDVLIDLVVNTFKDRKP
jgi:hypothetical protein